MIQSCRDIGTKCFLIMWPFAGNFVYIIYIYFTARVLMGAANACFLKIISHVKFWISQLLPNGNHILHTRLRLIAHFVIGCSRVVLKISQFSVQNLEPKLEPVLFCREKKYANPIQTCQRVVHGFFNQPKLSVFNPFFQWQIQSVKLNVNCFLFKLHALNNCSSSKLGIF